MINKDTLGFVTNPYPYLPKPVVMGMVFWSRGAGWPQKPQGYL